MDRTYQFYPTRYACPQCGSSTDKESGPDQITKYQCQECEWWETFNSAADEFATEQLTQIEDANT